jgi:diguanylate cyclase (GGDEF)-like protein
MASNPAASPQPFNRDVLFRQIGPLVGALMMGLLYASAARIGDGRETAVAQGATLIGLTVVLTVALPWRRLPEFLKIGPPLLFLLVAFRLPELAEVRTASGAAFIFLPVFWLAMFGTRLELTAGLMAVAVGLFAPLPASRAGEDLVQAAVMTGIAAAAGFALHQGFAQIRNRAERLELLAGTDPLTGLANRRTWEERVPGLLASARDDRVPACVVVVDIDHFKLFNDGRGHQEGDRVLREAASAWRRRIRQTDLLARVGGDEFAVLLAGCSVEAASGIARRLSSLDDMPVTASAGVAEWDGRESPGDLFARADAALYRAKAAGRDRVEFARQSR